MLTSFLIPTELRKRAEAQSLKRESIHKYHKTSRPLSKNYEFIGLMGECAVQLFLGLKVDWSLRPQGDRGKDFLYRGYILDVKTARKPYNLIREVEKPHGDILILAGINNALTEVKLIGWEYDRIIVQRPFRDFGYGVINHYIHASKLKSMNDLLNIEQKLGIYGT